MLRDILPYAILTFLLLFIGLIIWALFGWPHVLICTVIGVTGCIIMELIVKTIVWLCEKCDELSDYILDEFDKKH